MNPNYLSAILIYLDLEQNNSTSNAGIVGAVLFYIYIVQFCPSVGKARMV